MKLFSMLLIPGVLAVAVSAVAAQPPACPTPAPHPEAPTTLVVCELPAAFGYRAGHAIGFTKADALSKIAPDYVAQLLESGYIFNCKTFVP